MRNIFVLIFTVVLLGGCAGGKKSINKILKSTDPEYKLRMAEQFFVKKKYSKAQAIYEDIMPYYRHLKEFEDIYYKYAYSAYYQQDYLNAENLFKTFLELFPNSPKADELDYMRAYTYYKQSPRAELDQTDTEKAIGLFQIFINTHPNSPRNKEAYEIIEKLRAKLEVKAYKAAQLYYDLGQFRAAGVSFTNVLNTFPESSKADEYKLMIIRSYFRYAELSIEEKKVERFEQVITECNEFIDRFPESKLSKEVERFLNQSNNNLKILNNEQVKTPA
jgi:outer membrane protein assembly factor BamD